MSSISIAGLSWRTPTHDTLFTDLSLTFGPVRTGLVGRNGTGKTTLLRLISGVLKPPTGTIIRPPLVGYLRQNPEQAAHTTLADLFGVTEQLAVLGRAERGEALADDLARADWTLEARLQAALWDMGVDQGPGTRLFDLSGGQRTRAGIAALMFRAPDVILLDEPTNHLDRAGRTRVIEALRRWQGCVVVASHDRELLEEMDAIVELNSNGAATYAGPYSAYRAAKVAERARARESLMRADRALEQTQRRAQKATERKARTERQGKRLRHTGSQSKLLLDAAKERSEASSGAAARLRARQAQEAEAALTAARAAVEIHEPLSMDIPACGLAASRQVLRVTELGVRYGANPVFADVSFVIHGPERVAIEGANGAGKSTLLACISGQIQPQTGAVSVGVPAAFIDQDIGFLDPDETVRDALARLDPQADETERRATLARFLFRGADAAQKIGTLCGGQRMRAGLACTLGRSPARQLLLLDEPDNHLDLEALETLEAALNAYDGALVVVSHDRAFLERIGVTRRILL